MEEAKLQPAQPAAAPAKAPAAAAKPAELPSTAAAYEDFENSQIRKVIAERLTYSKQNIPHYYVTVQVQVDALLALRAKLNKHSSSKISVTFTLYFFTDMVFKT